MRDPGDEPVHEALERTIGLACSPERAFQVFVDHVDLWWPRGHRRVRDGALRFDGERLVDRAPDGSEWTMASVVERVAPSHLKLDWFPGSPKAPTSVEIGFLPEGAGTRVTIVHRPLSAEASAIWEERVATFAGGWDAVLPALAAFVATKEDD